MIKVLIIVLLSKYELSIGNKNGKGDKELPEISFERATLAQRKSACKVCYKAL